VNISQARAFNFKAAIYKSSLLPAVLTGLAMATFVGAVILSSGGDPLALARLGTRYLQADPSGSEGYDGQFVVYIARDLNPSTVAVHLDAPAYRYQRILLPLLTRIFSFGRQELLPWVLAGIGVLSQTLGTWLVARILALWGINPWFSLIYGFWVGFGLGVRLDLPEPLAYTLIAAALLASESARKPLSWMFYFLALFAKEVTLLFVFAAVLSCLWQRRWKESITLVMVTLVPFFLFQAWLWSVFGSPGLGSGGAMATSFELFPYMGLWRIWTFSHLYFLGMALVFVPAIVLPSMWGLIVSLRGWIAGKINVVVLALFLNSLAMAFLPFSTYREPGGVLRFASGLVMAVLLYASRYQHLRVLRYSIFWLALNVFLLK